MEKKYDSSNQREYSCEKCNSTNFEQGKISTTGSGLSKFFNMQNNSFVTISCTKCGYTELFKGEKAGVLANIFDVLGN